MLCSGARVTSCGAASLGVSLRWCLVRGLLRRSCVTALGCVGGGLVRSCVAGCAGDGAGVWGRRELGSGAPATLSGLRRGSCVAGGGTLSRGWYAAGGRTLRRGIVAGVVAWAVGRGVVAWVVRHRARRRWRWSVVQERRRKAAMEREDLTRQEARSAIKELAQALLPLRTFICQRMCLPDLNGAAARKRWGGTGRWNRDRLMRSAFGGVVGAGGDGMSCRDGVVRGFGRRDALGGRRDAVGVSLVLLACSQPRIAAQRAVCGRRAARVRPCVRRGALLPARTGARWCSAPRPVVAESGRRAVCRCCGWAFPTLRPD